MAREITYAYRTSWRRTDGYCRSRLLSCKAHGTVNAAACVDRRAFIWVFPAYQLLISYGKAQDVVKNNEMLDSRRWCLPAPVWAGIMSIACERRQ